MTDTTSTLIKPRQYPIVLIVLAVIIFSPMAYIQSYVLTKAMADFSLHILFAEQIKNGIATPSFVMAHAGWEILLLIFNILFGIPFQLANLIILLLCEALTVFILLRWFWPSPDVKIPPLWKTGVVILGISVAAPISILWFLDQKFYLGYIGIVSYHNPTIILLRPLALLQFIYALRCFDPRPISRFTILGMAIISILAAFAKPSFAICLIPAMVILTLYRILQKKRVDVIAFLIGFILPTMFMLAVQFLITYQENISDGILFAPFIVMSSYSDFLLPKFLLSILFPLLVTITYRRQAWHDIRMRLAWLIFIFGGLYTYFLAEGGIRFFDGNFTWSGEIGSFLLFAASSLFFLDVAESSGKSRLFLGFIWLCHIALGIIYYGYFLTAHIYV